MVSLFNCFLFHVREAVGLIFVVPSNQAHYYQPYDPKNIYLFAFYAFIQCRNVFTTTLCVSD